MYCTEYSQQKKSVDTTLAIMINVVYIKKKHGIYVWSRDFAVDTFCNWRVVWISVARHIEFHPQSYISRHKRHLDTCYYTMYQFVGSCQWFILLLVHETNVRISLIPMSTAWLREQHVVRMLYIQTVSGSVFSAVAFHPATHVVSDDILRCFCEGTGVQY